MNIRKIRKEKCLTVRQLADLSSLSKRTLEDIIQRGNCLVSIAIKLADALGVTLDELVNSQSNFTVEFTLRIYYFG